MVNFPKTTALYRRVFSHFKSSIESSSIGSPSLEKRHISSMFNDNEKYRPHILVIGGAYGGFSVITNVLNSIERNPQLSSPLPPPPLEDCKIRTTPRITILDERDGICQ